MSVRFYFDVHIRSIITKGLRSRGVDVITAQEDDAAELEDEDLLVRATSLGRVLFTQDDDFLRIAATKQQEGEDFAGLIYAHQLNVTDGQCIDDLEFIAGASEPEEWWGKVLYLPL